MRVYIGGNGKLGDALWVTQSCCLAEHLVVKERLELCCVVGGSSRSLCWIVGLRKLDESRSTDELVPGIRYGTDNRILQLSCALKSPFG